MKRNAALVVAFLCLLAFVMPWGAFVSDPFYIHTWSIFASTLIVITCNRLSAAVWSSLIQISECICIIYQANVIFNWDNQYDAYYIYHDAFMLGVLILELLFIAVSIRKISAAIDEVTGHIRRAFLSFVCIYPIEYCHFSIHDHSGCAQC